MEVAQLMLEKLTRENQYYRKQLDEQSGQMLKIQHGASQLANELTILRKGYTLLNELQIQLESAKSVDEIFENVVKKLANGLQMTKVAILKKGKSSGKFYLSNRLGFTSDEEAKLKNKKIIIDPKTFGISSELDSIKHLAHNMDNRPDSFSYLLVNSDTASTEFIERIRKEFNCPYFILAPVFSHYGVIAYIFTGRIAEVKLISPKIDASYGETLKSISGFVTALIHQLESRRYLDKLVKARTKILNDTIDELVKVKISKKTLTGLFIITLIVFLFVDAFIDPMLQRYVHNYYYILLYKALIAFLIKPIETMLEKYFYARSELSTILFKHYN